MYTILHNNVQINEHLQDSVLNVYNYKGEMGNTLSTPATVNVVGTLHQQMGVKTCEVSGLVAGFPLACNPATSQVQIQKTIST